VGDARGRRGDPGDRGQETDQPTWRPQGSKKEARGNSQGTNSMYTTPAIDGPRPARDRPAGGTFVGQRAHRGRIGAIRSSPRAGEESIA
jgi:hypothetical protein